MYFFSQNAIAIGLEAISGLLLWLRSFPRWVWSRPFTWAAVARRHLSKLFSFSGLGNMDADRRLLIRVGYVGPADGFVHLSGHCAQKGAVLRKALLSMGIDVVSDIYVFNVR